MPDPATVVCCVCKSSNEKHRFHRFPTQFPVVYQEWIDALKLADPPKKSDLVCSQHFNKKLHYWPHFRSPKAVLKDDAVPSLLRKVEKPVLNRPNRRSSKRLKKKNGIDDLVDCGATSESSDAEVTPKKPCAEKKLTVSKITVANIEMPKVTVEKVSPQPPSNPPTAPENSKPLGGFLARLEALNSQLKDHKWDDCSACLDKMNILLDHINESHKVAVSQEPMIKSRVNPIAPGVQLPEEKQNLKRLTAPVKMPNGPLTKQTNDKKKECRDIFLQQQNFKVIIQEPRSNVNLRPAKAKPKRSNHKAVSLLKPKKEPPKTIPNILARRLVVKNEAPVKDESDVVICLKILKKAKITEFICGACGQSMATQEIGVKHIRAHYEARRKARLSTKNPQTVQAEPSKPPTPTTSQRDVAAKAAEKYCLAYISCEANGARKEVMDFSPENLIEYCPEDGH